MTHRVSYDHGRVRIVVAEIQGDLHPRVAAADDEHSLVAVHVAPPVQACVHDGPLEFFQPGDLRHDGLGVLASSHHHPPAHVLGPLLLASSSRRHRPHPPEAGGGVVLGGHHRGVEHGLDVELPDVGLEVGDELLLGGVRREPRGERQQGELAEPLREVEAEAVVRPELPQRCDAVGSFEDQAGNAFVLQAGGDSQPRRPSPDDDRPREKHAPLRLGADHRRLHRHEMAAAVASLVMTVERIVDTLAFSLHPTVIHRGPLPISFRHED